VFLNLTFSRSGSLKARASSLLSMTDAAATSRGVDPRIDGDAEERRGNMEKKNIQVNKRKVFGSLFPGY